MPVDFQDQGGYCLTAFTGVRTFDRIVAFLEEARVYADASGV